jgi:outer membrane biogenesis lipoprotein LolB
MLHSDSETAAHRNIMKFAVAAAAMAVLVGCAVSVPLRPLATSSQNSHELFRLQGRPQVPQRNHG